MSPLRVKDERQWWDDTEDSGAGAAAADDLYAEHEVKHELVLGPERLQPQDVAFALRAAELSSGASSEPVKREGSPGEAPRSGGSCGAPVALNTCFVSLERFPVDKELHPCKKCLKTFLRKSSLRTHTRICSAIKRKSSRSTNKLFIDCKEEKRTTSRERLSGRPSSMAHRLICAKEKPYTSDFCKKNFSRKPNLSFHRLIHTGKRPYTCNICNQKFLRKHHLTRHLFIHTGEKPHICNICNKQFSFKPHLTRHLFIHTGEKPYICYICKKQFSRKHHLTRHQLIHTGEKPHICNICNKQYSLKHHLTRHWLTHTICYKQFESASVNTHKA